MYNQEIFTKLRNSIKNEIAKMTDCSMDEVSITPTLRCYCFNDINVPRNPKIYLKVKYPSKYNLIDANKLINISNGAIACIIGTTLKPLEIFLAENQISTC